jgi:hypothetical protein
VEKDNLGTPGFLLFLVAQRARGLRNEEGMMKIGRFPAVLLATWMTLVVEE